MTVHLLRPVTLARVEQPALAADRPSYARPLLVWVRRRARRLQRAFGIDRHLAVIEAGEDYAAFTGSRRRMAKVVQLGVSRHG